MIQTRFDADLNAFIVEFPAFVTLETLHDWGKVFISELQNHDGGVALVINTNQHNFESVECLRWLRTFLAGEPIISSSVSRAAFIQPSEYRRPEVVSDVEAYFSSMNEAYRWLQ